MIIIFWEMIIIIVTAVEISNLTEDIPDRDNLIVLVLGW
jgi:hypothetical protein